MNETVLDVIFILNGAGSKAFVGIREEEVVVGA